MGSNPPEALTSKTLREMVKPVRQWLRVIDTLRSKEYCRKATARGVMGRAQRMGIISFLHAELRSPLTQLQQRTERTPNNACARGDWAGCDDTSIRCGTDTPTHSPTRAPTSSPSAAPTAAPTKLGRRAHCHRNEDCQSNLCWGYLFQAHECRDCHNHETRERNGQRQRCHHGYWPTDAPTATPTAAPSTRPTTRPSAAWEFRRCGPTGAMMQQCGAPFVPSYYPCRHRMLQQCSATTEAACREAGCSCYAGLVGQPGLIGTVYEPQSCTHLSGA